MIEIRHHDKTCGLAYLAEKPVDGGQDGFLILLEDCHDRIIYHVLSITYVETKKNRRRILPPWFENAPS